MTLEPPPAVAPTTQGATHTAGAQLVTRAVALLAQIGSLAVVARAANEADWATWGTVTILVVAASFLIDPGLSPILVRRLSIDPASSPVPRATLVVRVALGAFAVLLVTGLTLGLRGLDALPIAAALGGQLLPRAIVLNATPWLQVDQRLHRQTVLEALSAGLGFACLFIAAHFGAGVWLLAIVGFTAPATLLAWLMRRELRITPSRALDVPGPQRERVLSVIRETGPFAIAILIAAGYTRLSAVFLQLADISDTERGQFFFAFQFVEQMIVAAGIIGAAVLPLLAVRARAHDLIGDEVTNRLLVAVTAIGALIAAVVIVIATPLTDAIGGPSKAGAGAYLELMAPMSAVVLPAMILGYVYVSINSTRRYLVYTLISLALTIVANIAFTIPYGAGASARIVWLTEAFVVMLPLLPVARASAHGLRTIGLVVVLIAVAAIAAESTAYGVPALGAGAALALATAAIAFEPIRWLTHEVTQPLRARIRPMPPPRL